MQHLAAIQIVSGFDIGRGLYQFDSRLQSRCFQDEEYMIVGTGEGRTKTAQSLEGLDENVAALVVSVLGSAEAAAAAVPPLLSSRRAYTRAIRFR